MSTPEDIGVAEALWRDAEEERQRARAALAHAEGVQRLCDRVLLGEPLPLLTAGHWARIKASVWAALGATTDTGDSTSSPLAVVVSVFGGPHTGKSTLGRLLAEALVADVEGAQAVLHDDGRDAGPLTFADHGPTVIVRHRDSIFNSAVSLLTCFTGPYTSLLAHSYRLHLQCLHGGVTATASPVSRRLQLVLQHAAAPVGRALVVWEGQAFQLLFHGDALCL